MYACKGATKKAFSLDLFFILILKRKNMYSEGVNVFNWSTAAIHSLKNIVWLLTINAVKIRLEIKGNQNPISVYPAAENDLGK